MTVEERVQIAINNWAPRFLSNGVDPNDFQSVTKRIERWDDWNREWSACAAVHERMGEEAEEQEYYQSAGYHYFHAAITYHFGKFLFVHHPVELRTAHEHVVGTYQKGLPYFDFPGERVAIAYEGGGAMYGIFRKPWHTPKPPVVILIPGLDSVKEELHNYGDDFLRRVKAAIANSGAYSFADGFEQRPLLTREAFVYRLKATDESTARTLLQPFSLQGVMEKVSCPLLVIMGRQDRIVSPESAEQMVAEAGGEAELWMFEDGNHVCNNIPYKHRPQQADWMRKKLYG